MVQVQMHSSEVLFAPLRLKQKNRIDAKKNQENNSCGSSAGALLRSSLCAFAVKPKNRIDAKKNQENNSRGSSAGALLRSFFAPLRLKQKTSEPSLRKVVLLNNRTLFLRSVKHDEPY